MDVEIGEYIARREEVLGRVRRLIIDSLLVRREPAEIDPDTPLFGTGLGLDSVDAVELVASLEQEFGIQILGFGESNPAWLRTVNTLVDLVLSQVGGQRREGQTHG